MNDGQAGSACNDGLDLGKTARRKLITAIHIGIHEIGAWGAGAGGAEFVVVWGSEVMPKFMGDNQGSRRSGSDYLIDADSPAGIANGSKKRNAYGIPVEIPAGKQVSDSRMLEGRSTGKFAELT